MSYSDKEKQPKFKSGFVAIIGRPNVGKSTLMNQVIGQKIAIMSDKPQTTRNKIHGVYTTDEAQIVFLDTPGIHKSQSKLGDYMVKAAESALSEVDAILFLVDVAEGLGGGDRYIIEQLKKVKTPVLLVMNKIDQVHPEALLPVITTYKDLYPFAEIVPISAMHGNNVSTLLDQVIKYLPEGPQYYPADQVTDHPEQFVCAELIREKNITLDAGGGSAFDRCVDRRYEVGRKWRCAYFRRDLCRTGFTKGNYYRKKKVRCLKRWARKPALTSKRCWDPKPSLSFG